MWVLGIANIKGVFKMPRNKLVVKQSEELVNSFKEEMAEEFGLYRPAAERDAITPKLIKKQKNDKNK
jgi:hypothetical protein